jgi:hypothetical protein
MSDYIINDKQLKSVITIISEQDVQDRVDYCKDTFGTRTAEYKFCNKAQSYIKSNKGYQANFRELLEVFVDKVALEKIKLERLTKGSKILQDGIKEIEDFNEKMKDFCRNLDIDELISGLVDDSHVYYKRPDGNYSVFNRIDTNYSALALALTWYYHSKGAFSMLTSDLNQKLNKIDWNALVVSWVDHFFDPDLKPLDPRVQSFQLEIPLFTIDQSPPYSLFKILFDPKNIIVDKDKVFSSILKVLKSVRERGNQSEDLFEKKLQDYDIDYIRYARDYGFVDRFLGVDFLVKKGNEWLPVQVKTTRTEPQYRIEDLDCDEPIIAIKDGDDFRLNNARGFERFFCKTLKVCKSS